MRLGGRVDCLSISYKIKIGFKCPMESKKSWERGIWGLYFILLKQDIVAGCPLFQQPMRTPMIFVSMRFRNSIKVER
jgi:hypothetical protein